MKRPPCTVEGCERAQYAGGICQHHYYERQEKKCSICDAPLYARGYCISHWRQLKKHGHTYKHRLELNDYEFDGDVCRIALTDQYGELKGYALIDSSDYDKCKDIRWNFAIYDGTPYIQAYIENTTVKLHQHIMNTKGTGQMVDHINRNPLDNRKENLRFCTRGQNLCNSIGHLNRASKYKGVTPRGDGSNKWRAYIAYNGKRINIGSFQSEANAAYFYNEAARKLHGEFARYNQLF
jgi:hypothetical protein